jgi:adenosylcobyric acid synthase
MAVAIAVWGTQSGAGKSLLVTALARFYARRGWAVRPFKALNMSNHARVGVDGEMAAAQYFQALAAGTVPQVAMNPVLLKPTGDRRSHVILLGRPAPHLADRPWRERQAELAPAVEASLRALLAEADLVLLEGAGSPAERNLWPDLPNLRVAELADARALLVADVDRGGALAQVVGTVELLGPYARRLAGVVLNKFRGDLELLRPAYGLLVARTGVPVLGTLPWLRHALPEEDALLSAHPAPAAPRAVVAIVRYPHASNLDEFAPLFALPVAVRWAQRPEELVGADLIVLPGSRNVPADLEFLRPFVPTLEAHRRAGRPLLAICGGAQMLGRWVEDPHGLERAGRHPGLGWFPYTTTLEEGKVQRRERVRLPELEGPWRALAGRVVEGYRIHHGRSEGFELVAADGPVLATLLHGLFENPDVQEALFGARAPDLDATFDALADAVEEHLDAAALERLAEPPTGPAAPRGRLVLVLGGARSGKSRFALRLAGPGAALVVTAEPRDAEMAARIARHRQERDPDLEVLEAPRDVPGAVRRAQAATVVVDCLTLWLSNLLEWDADPDAALVEFVAAVRGSGKTVIAVANEVGLGLVPTTALGRAFRDWAGRWHQALADAAEAVYFVVAGQPLRLR